MRKGLSIVHFHPLELYPPVTNLIHYLNQKDKSLEVKVYTTQNSQNLPDYVNEKIKITRFPAVAQNLSKLKRFRGYVSFNAGCFFYLLTTRPAKVFYYDTLSSFPVILYYFFSLKRVKVFIHYHEYVSPQEHKDGMLLLKFFHALEKKILTKAHWLSHTNEDRMKLFREDYPEIPNSAVHITPNFPPLEWKKYEQKKENLSIPLKLLYIGSISLETMYFKELFTWISSLHGEVLLDIYSRNIPDNVHKYLLDSANTYVKLKGAIDYHLIPQLCSNYDIGLILYKAHIPNVKYCASNKLFEYYACGLDVWVSQEMIGSEPFVTKTTYPKVLMVDCENLKLMDLSKAISHEGLTFKPSEYYCEPVYAEINRCLNHA